MLNSNIRFGIRLKFSIALFIVFGVCLILLNQVIVRQIQQNYEEVIARELKDISSNFVVYTRQLLMINNLNNDESGLRKITPEALLEFGNTHNGDFAIYTHNGILIDKTDQFTGQGQSELKYAIEGQSAYVLLPGENDTLLVQYSSPITIENKLIGILRGTMDKTSLRMQGNQTASSVFQITIYAFIGVFLLVQLVARSVTRPVLILARLSKKLAYDVENEVWSENVLPSKDMIARSDEVGLLAQNYVRLFEKTSEQFALICQDRDSIKTLYEQQQNFYNNVTHELKTPLTAIQGYAQIIKDNGFSDEEFFNKGIDLIIDESKRLHEMVIRLIELSYKEHMQPFERMHYSEILAESIEAMKIKARRHGNTFDCSIDPEIYIFGQQYRIKQLFINLIDNAIKYGDKDGIINIRLYKESGSAVFSITNTGAGLTEQQQREIFMPFHRTNKEYSREQGSCGLGLTICKKIVSDHNAEIETHSVLNKTTTFTVRLPMGDDKNA